MTEWVSVSSKAIRKIGYDATSSRMFIDFEDSHPIYTFCGVPVIPPKNNRGDKWNFVT